MNTSDHTDNPERAPETPEAETTSPQLSQSADAPTAAVEPSPSAPSEPPAPKPKGAKNWYKIALIAILAIIGLSLIIISAFLVMSGQDKGNNNDPQPTPTPTPTATTTPSATPTPSPAPTDVTAGWSTFTSSAYGFTVKYPTSLQVSQKESDYEDGEYYTSIFKANQSDPVAGTAPIFIFYQFPTGCGTGPDEPTPTPAPTKQVKFNNQIIEVEVMCGHSGPFILPVRNGEGQDMYIWLNYLQDESADQELFGNVLATIRGLEVR